MSDLMCRKCGGGARKVTHEYGNERVVFTYTHGDGRRCEIAVIAVLGDEWLREDATRTPSGRRCARKSDGLAKNRNPAA